MKTIDFDYHLPTQLIAQNPTDKRENSRLMVVDRHTKEIYHKHFYDILDYLNAGDVLVVNNTRVLPAKLIGILDNSKELEILLHKRLDSDEWEILVKNSKRYKVGTQLVFGDNLKGVFCERVSNGNRVLKLEYNGILEEVLSQIGQMPLPHYIKSVLQDKERYQTVYSKGNAKSVAAPTAGLHFSSEIIDKLKSKGIEWLEVSLNVGLGTFRPVKTEDLALHNMHAEYFVLSEETANAINLAKSQGRRIIAVGTTSVRVLESASTQDGKLIAQSNDTQIFIYPPYKFKVVDGLITNFHLPKSTLIMLVSAFMGHAQTMHAYDLAVKNNYRFFSFGDGMMIL
ncbi:MAG: tRNA preQ1(34) S-adenosylmethionine ribosyltransferase-isomerase QueA [Firmicutes bacterium]|nr:tRNA preQ1(34) S-adenosylmethionine ribosyltransferase-isomerase QueA [Bacillota bacterium]